MGEQIDMTDEDSLSVVFYVHTNARLQGICTSLQQPGLRVQPHLMDQCMVRVVHSVPCTVSSIPVQALKHHCSLAGGKKGPTAKPCSAGTPCCRFCLYVLPQSLMHSSKFKASSFHIAAAAAAASEQYTERGGSSCTKMSRYVC